MLKPLNEHKSWMWWTNNSTVIATWLQDTFPLSISGVFLTVTFSRVFCAGSKARWWKGLSFSRIPQRFICGWEGNSVFWISRVDCESSGPFTQNCIGLSRLCRILFPYVFFEEFAHYTHTQNTKLNSISFACSRLYYWMLLYLKVI